MNEMVRISLSPCDLHVDGFGNPIGNDVNRDQSVTDKEQNTFQRVTFGPIPKVSEIALINHPMITGNTMIDTLAPIGRGQNMLLIGSQLDDMRAVARDFLKTQVTTTKPSTSPTVCVYASTEQDQTVAYDRIKNAGIAEDIHYVGMKPTSQTKDATSFAAEAVLVVNAAIAVAESYALKDHRHAVVVVDTIDLHKTLHDATTRILVDTFGIQSVVQQDPNGGGTSSSEMRSFYSSFIQRAGQYNAKMGGGSVTLLLLTTIPPTATASTDVDDNDQMFTLDDFAHCSENIKNRLKIIVEKGIALTAATLRKINIPLPTVSEYDRRMQLQHIDELISMSDGQIWFDDAISTRPPMDPQKSITRIGVGADTPSRADAPAIRRIAEGIRLELVQSAMSSMTGTVLSSSATQQQIRRQQALLLAMYQPPGIAPIRRLSDSCAVLLSAQHGYLDHCIDQNIVAGSDDGIALIEQLLMHVHTNVHDVMDEIDETLDITDLSKKKLTESIAEFFQTSGSR
jgi:F-type H+-transporting ATPase subunit alpha